VVAEVRIRHVARHRHYGLQFSIALVAARRFHRPWFGHVFLADLAGDGQCGRRLPESLLGGIQADQVAATVVGGEVGPLAGPDVDRQRIAGIAGQVADLELIADKPPARKPAEEEVRTRGERRTFNGVVVDGGQGHVPSSGSLEALRRRSIQASISSSGQTLVFAPRSRPGGKPQERIQR